MKLLSVLKQLLRQGRLRVLLLMAVTGYCGYMMAGQVLPIQQVDVAAALWDKDSMADCVLVNYEGKVPASGFGYNLHWLDTLEELKTLPGARTLYTSEAVSASFDKGDNWGTLVGYAISQEWLTKAQLSLSAGTMEEYRPESGYVPALLSATLRGRFQVGDEIEMQCSSYYLLVRADETAEVQKIRFKVTGFLPDSGAYPNFWGATVISDASVYSVMAGWYGDGLEQADQMLIPLEALADYPIYRYSTNYLMAFQLEESVAKNPEATQDFIQMLARRGIGTAATDAQLSQRIRSASQSTISLGVTMIVLFLALALFSVVTFQTAFIYERKKSLAVLHLMGIPWRTIGGGWMLLCAVCGVIPSLVGMCVGVWKRTAGAALLPTTPYLYLMPLGLLVVFGAIIAVCLRGLSRTDAILLLHED